MLTETLLPIGSRYGEFLIAVPAKVPSAHWENFATGIAAPNDATYVESTGYEAGNREGPLLGPITANIDRVTQIKHAWRSKGVTITNTPAMSVWIELDDVPITSAKQAQIVSAAFHDWQAVFTQDDFLPGYKLLDKATWNAATKRVPVMKPISGAGVAAGVDYEQE